MHFNQGAGVVTLDGKQAGHIERIVIVLSRMRSRTW